MSAAPLITPPGALPDGAPKGLHDLLFSPPPSVATLAQQAVEHSLRQHSLLWFGLLAVLVLLAGLIFWLHRDWRGRLLRWQLTRLNKLASRAPDTLPEPVGAALSWALARYFRQRPGLDRTALGAGWQAHVAAFDRLRFAATPAPVEDWQALLQAIDAHSRRTNSTPPKAPAP